MSDRQYYQELLHTLFVYMLNSNGSVRGLEQIIEKALAAAQKTVATTNDGALTHTTRALGAVFYRWFRDPKYLNAEALPRALPMRGKRLSIESLLREEGIRGAALDTLLAKILTLRLVKKVRQANSYVPISQVAVFQRTGPELLEHVGSCVARLLATVQYNTRSENRGEPLIERAASVVDLRPSDIPAFRAFTRLQAQSFLASVDDWLESRRLKRSARGRGPKGAAAGVHVYAYLSR